jgi:hypothetical protein
MRATGAQGRRVLATIPRVARDYGIAESILYGWANRGELVGAVRLSGRWDVRVLAFEAWLRATGDAGAGREER